MAATKLSEAERKYFVRKAGGATQQETTAQIKRRYWSAFLTASANATFADLESRWMMKVITTAGGTIGSNYNADLWKQMVSAISKTPQKQTSANMLTFYLNAP